MPFPGQNLSPWRVPSSKQKTLVLSWNWNPARSSARARLPFREPVSAASGAAARASSVPRPGPSRAAGHRLLPRLSGPRPPRGGPGSGGPAAVAALSHRGRGAGDQRRPRGQSPQSRSSRRCAGSGQSPRGPSQVSNTVLRVRGAPRAGCDPPRSTPAAPHPRPSVIYSERGDMRGARGLETMPSLFRCPGQLHALIMQGSPYPVLVL